MDNKPIASTVNELFTILKDIAKENPAATSIVLMVVAGIAGVVNLNNNKPNGD